jgi:hypothetical protein
MEKVMKIEIVLGDSKAVWAEIAPSTVPLRHKEDNIRATARKMWLNARENGDLKHLHGANKFAKVIVTCGNGLVTIEL